MRVWILSDLHLHVGDPWTPPAIPEADVAVVAGDVCEGLVDAIAWLADTIRPHMRVVFAAGNHEFYRRTISEELALGQVAARKQGIDFLENDDVVIDGVAFVGCTPWTDYGLHGDALRPRSIEAARRGLNDHRLITSTRKPRWARFRPEDALRLHEGSRRYLETALAEPVAPGRQPPRARVVVTHHAPSAGSVAPRYGDDPLSAAFASRLDDLIERAEPDIWVHGHTHNSFDYRVAGTRVLCNPKGYGRENAAGFDPALVVDVAP